MAFPSDAKAGSTVWRGPPRVLNESVSAMSAVVTPFPICSIRFLLSFPPLCLLFGDACNIVEGDAEGDDLLLIPNGLVDVSFDWRIFPGAKASEVNKRLVDTNSVSADVNFIMLGYLKMKSMQRCRNEWVAS